ncbi:MAG: phosphonoacetaldehyde hydrolase [Candidatus Competibacteraceae bacterium]|nr:phosphonoacetaldehyde hydrolase [Candidatus Competibacteraceae bacterium]MBK8753302.1 phosphonoacetaldehyde hydrolase [Candidatus Competibacteraceae bacterium]
MHFHYQRSYRGPVQAVILDWAGTTVDFGSLAPAMAFVQLFAEQGIAISVAEVRGPMGTEKREHIRQLCQLPTIAACWNERYGTEPDEADIDRLYEAFVPLQIAAIRDCAQLIPGCRETVAALRERGIRIGANTGYSREMAEPLMHAAADQGYIPDSAVCATEVPRGRPYPYMSLKNAIELGVETVQACVKVDDTVPGIEEGLNAGMWTVGVAISGNEIGLPLAGWEALPFAEQQRRRERAYSRLLASGAHYVIDSIAALPCCLDAIEVRLARGERP